MRVVTFKSVLWDLARSLGMDPTRDLNLARAGTLTAYINERVKEGWKFEFFPEWTVVEPRYYRDVYADGAFIEAGNERFHVASGLYFQALRDQASATEAPAVLTNGVYEENSDWWAELAPSYSGADWATGTVFAVGDKTRRLENGSYYQCHTAHTAGAAFDETKFGILTAFDKFIAYEQTEKTPIDEVKGVYRRNPRVFPDRGGKLDFRPSANGIQVEVKAPNVVWVEFRLRPPVFTSTPWSASATYDLGDVVYYAPDCYRSAIGNNQEPVDGVVNWIRVDFPDLLARFVKRAALADTLTDQKQQDRKNTELAEAYSYLQDASDYALAQQGQFERATVQTYGT